MKKFSKLLCVLLMLALICTSIVFAVGAATTDTVVKTENGSDMGAVSVATLEGNSLPTNPSWSLFKQKTDPNGDGKYNDGEATADNMLDMFVVTPAGSEDGYVVMAAGEKQNGGSFQNVQHTYSYNGPVLTSDSYYVVDMDLATPTKAITSVAISLPNRNVTGEWESSGGFPFGTNVEITKYVNLDANWIHFTVVNSMKTNEQYIFVNGEFVCKTGNKAYNNDQVDATKTLRANGIKLEVAYADSVTNPHMIYQNESLAFDNLARRDIVDADGIAKLDAIMAQANPNLKTWDGYPTSVRTGSLPNYVKIDGIKYNSLADAANVLTGNDYRTVEVINPFPAALYVNCDATINTNGYDVAIRAGEGVTLSKDGNVITTDAPYQASMTETQNGSATALAGASKYNAADNSLLDYFLFNINENKEGKTGHLNSYLATTPSTGNQFITFYNPGDVNGNSNTYFEFRIMKEVTYTAAPQYIVYDMDVAALSDATFPFMTVARQDGAGMWGAANPSLNVMNAMGGIGEFRHLTIVIDLANNDLYAFNNNSQAYYTEKNGFTSDANFEVFKTAEKWNFNSIRLGSNALGAYAFDNVYIRHLTGDAAAALNTALAGNAFADWSGNVYDADYEMPTIGAVASVNGVEYMSAAAASAALIGNDHKDVVIMRPFAGTLEINASATIETNGFDFDYTLGAGVTEVKAGTVINTTAPYQSSASFELEYDGSMSNGDYTVNDASRNALKAPSISPVSGNPLGSLFVAKANDFHPYVVSPAGSNDAFVLLKPTHSGAAEKDIQFTYYMSSDVQMTGGTSYYVIDVDLATETQIGNSIYICPVLRFANGEGGTPFGATTNLEKVIKNDGSWQHLTIVGDMADNNMYIFVDGKLVQTNDAEPDGHGAYNGTSSGATSGAASATNLKFQAVKFSNALSGNNVIGEDDTTYIDNVAARVYASNTAAGDIEAAIAAGSLAGWSGAIAGKGGNLPAVATVDGTDYYSVSTVEAALKGSDDKAVDICRDNFGTITVEGSATINTHGFDATLDTVTEYVPVFDDQLWEYVTVVGPYAYEQDGDIVTYTEVNTYNLYDFTTIAEWSYDYDEFLNYSTVYYAFGQKIEYAHWDEYDVYANAVKYGNALVDGHRVSFSDFELYDQDGELITEDVYSYAGNEGYYAYGTFYEEDNFELDIPYLYNYSLDTNYVVNIYVPAEYAVDGAGTQVTVGADTYYVFSSETISIADAYAKVNVLVSANGETFYVTLTDVCLTDYAVTILDGNFSDEMKTLIYATVEYAYEAFKKVPGNAGFTIMEGIIADYAEWAMEDKADYEATNTDDLSAIIKGAKFVVDSKICYVFTPAAECEITVTYEGIDGKVTKTSDGTDYIVLSDMKAYDLLSTITISGNGVSGTYNFEGYIAALKAANDDTTFVEAMYNYAVAANAYKLACNAAN